MKKMTLNIISFEEIDKYYRFKAKKDRIMRKTLKYLKQLAQQHGKK